MIKNINLYKYFFVLILIIADIFLTSCKKEIETVNQSDYVEIQLNEANVSDNSIFSEVQTWHTTNKRILVLFGYDFNYYPVLDNLKAFLQKNFGLDTDDGLIYPIVYPDGFKHGGRNYSSDLFSVLNDDSVDFSGAIILGAPENTHVALARLQDAWGGEIPFPIVALFPQDDVLGLESTCDFVIDKNQSGYLKNDSDISEEDSQFLEETPEILKNIIDYMIVMDSKFARNGELVIHVNQALKQKTVQYYVDPETGIPSVNHFILNVSSNNQAY